MQLAVSICGKPVRDHKLVAALAASTGLSGCLFSEVIGWDNKEGVHVFYVCLCVFSRVRGVFQAKLVHQEKEALLAGWDFQENKETPDLKGNQ